MSLSWPAFLGGALLGVLLASAWLGWQGRRREERLRTEQEQALRTERELRSEKEAELARERERRIHAHKDLENAEKNLRTAEQLERELSRQFENLSNRIYEEKRKTFAEESRSAVRQLLEPVREDLKGFRRKTEDLHQAAGRDHASLREQLHQLMDANTQISDDARNLTRALKGDSGMRGNWGEMVLERLLEESGLEEGREYRRQQSMDDGEGGRLRPDIVISLPEGRHVVIDSKVSLVDWERGVSLAQESPQQSEQALNAHAAAVRRHIQALGEKGYQDLEDVQGADLTLMFVPVEAAFLEALRRDPELYREAWQRRIAVVGPTTLLAVLRIIENLWRIEQGNRNAREIARQGAAMYDKLAGFVQTLDKVGRSLDAAQSSYEDAHKQLSSGRGNLLRRAERMKALGLQPKKSLPASEETEEEETEEEKTEREETEEEETKREETQRETREQTAEREDDASANGDDDAQERGADKGRGLRSAAGVDAQVAGVDTRAADVDVRSADVDAQVADVDTWAADADTRSADVDARTAGAGTQASDVDTRAAGVDVRAADVDARTAGADTRAAGADARAVGADMRAADGGRMDYTNHTGEIR